MATVTKAGDDTLVKSPQSIKSFERELGELFNAMTRAMGQQFKNQTIDVLTQETIAKFEDMAFNDAQQGNYSTRFLTLANSVSRKLRKRFNDDRINTVVSGLLGKVDDANKESLYGRMDKVEPLNVSALLKSDGTVEETNALILETTSWAERLRDNTLEDFSTQTLRAMALGQNIDQIGIDFNKLVTKRANNSKFLANNQVANFNSLLTKVRSQKLGLTQAIWVTSEDEKVRRCHRVRNGKVFDLDKGLFSSCDGLFLLPGIDFNCRCHYQLIVPDNFSFN